MPFYAPSSPIVIDPGTYRWRIGFSGQRTPKSVFFTETQDLDATATIVDGFVTSFCADKKSINYFQRYIHHSLEMLNCVPNESEICLAVPLHFNSTYRRQLAEVLFEGVGLKSVFFISQPLLAGYSSGQPTCMIIDSGATFTSIFGINNLHPVSITETLLPLGGKDLDRYLRHSNGRQLLKMNENELHFLKERYCSISADSSLPCSNQVCVLPDGQRIKLGSELNLTPEVLFNPSLSQMNDVLPIDETTIYAAYRASKEQASKMLKTVVFSGGNLKFHGVRSRLKMGLKHGIESSHLNRTVVRHPKMELAVWTGGSIFTSLSTFHLMTITRQNYKEEGSRIVSNRWL